MKRVKMSRNLRNRVELNKQEYSSCFSQVKIQKNRYWHWLQMIFLLTTQSQERCERTVILREKNNQCSRSSPFPATIKFFLKTEANELSPLQAILNSLLPRAVQVDKRCSFTYIWGEKILLRDQKLQMRQQLPNRTNLWKHTAFIDLLSKLFVFFFL